MIWFLISIPSAVLMVEGIRYVLAQHWLPLILSRVRRGMEEFIAAEDDDCRQSTVLQIGVGLLAGSLLLLAVLAIVVYWMYAPIRLWNPESRQQINFWIGLY